MKLGTTHFEGSRLREAREARALTVVALADLVDVTRQAIAQYESGTKSPSPEVMRRLVQVLDLPMEFFLRPVPPEARGTMFYRSMSSATKVARARAERRLSWFRRIVHYLHGYVEFPSPKFLDVSDMPDDPSFIDIVRIEQIAADARRFWGLGDGPISNVAWLLENNGALIVRHELAAKTLDAFSEWDEDFNRPFIVLGTDKESAARSRFDAAHELGHMLLHRRVPQSTLRNQAKFRLIEDQANYFASAFLLPSKSFTSEILTPSLDCFYSLKARWRVSIGCMIKRASNLGLLAQEQEQRLWINLTRRGWRKSEPLDDVQDAEQPRFVARAIRMLIDKHVLTIEDMATVLTLRIRDIEDVCGIRPAELSGHEPILRIGPSNSTNVPPSQAWEKSSSTGNWLFPIRKQE